jgi:hypothetical protein
MKLTTREVVEVVYERITAPMVFVVSNHEDSTTPVTCKHHKQVLKDLTSKVHSGDLLYTTIQALGSPRPGGSFGGTDEPRNYLHKRQCFLSAKHYSVGVLGMAIVSVWKLF